MLLKLNSIFPFSISFCFNSILNVCDGGTNELNLGVTVCTEGTKLKDFKFCDDGWFLLPLLTLPLGSMW